MLLLPVCAVCVRGGWASACCGRVVSVLCVFPVLFHLYWVAISLNIGLCMSAYVSFSCRLLMLSLYMWNCSNVFMREPFFCWCRMLSVSSMVPYVCPVSRMCCAYFEFVLLVRMACMCSLCRVLKLLPVWPMYFSGHVLHFISYIPLCLYLSGSWFLGCRCLRTVLLVL
jgi:hypothetical protein